MKIVVIGGTGLIGSKTVAILRKAGHEAVAASPKNGINSITGEGLKEAMAGTDVVVDLANSPSFEDKAVLEFFETSGRNLLAAETAAGVRHHVALSIVGTDRTPDNGYFRAKVAQEKLIEASGIPYTIIRATQFLEFLGAIADVKRRMETRSGSRPALFQPIAADDVAPSLPMRRSRRRRTASSRSPVPSARRSTRFIARYLKAVGDLRAGRGRPRRTLLGRARVDDRSLVPLGEARLGRIRSGRMDPPLQSCGVIRKCPGFGARRRGRCPQASRRSMRKSIRRSRDRDRDHRSRKAATRRGQRSRTP